MGTPFPVTTSWRTTISCVGRVGAVTLLSEVTCAGREAEPATIRRGRRYLNAFRRNIGISGSYGAKLPRKMALNRVKH